MENKRKIKVVTVSDKFQKGYQYEISQPVGRNFHPDFTPELTPKDKPFCTGHMTVASGKILTKSKSKCLHTGAWNFKAQDVFAEKISK